MRVLSIAAIQTAPVSGDLDATWDRFEAQVRAARRAHSRPHVNLVVVPELLLAAPGPLLLEKYRGGCSRRHGDSGPGHRPVVRARAITADLARARDARRADRGRPPVQYGTRDLARGGHRGALSQAVQPWRPYEELLPGSEFVTFDIPEVGRVGLAICFDGSFPEVSRQLAWLGAEVIIQPTLTTTRDREMEIVMARANAFANQVYVVNVNGAAPVGVGESVVVDPEGTIMQAAGGGEEVLFAVLDLDRVTLVREYGSHGINRPWTQLADQCALLQYPMFGGATVQAPDWVAADS